MAIVREDILSTYVGSTWSRATNRRIEKLRHQPKEVVNQNGDINEWKRRGIFVHIFLPPPFCQWIRPKSINHN